MKLEDVIKQTKPFASEKQKVMVNLFYTNNWLQNEMKSFLKLYDITLQQYNILRILRGANKPISTSVLRERMLDKMSDTTRLINRMIKKSWVSKVTCPSDKRLVDIQISDLGLGLLDRISHEMPNLEQKLNGLDKKDLLQLNMLLDKLRG